MVNHCFASNVILPTHLSKGQPIYPPHGTGKGKNRTFVLKTYIMAKKN